MKIKNTNTAARRQYNETIADGYDRPGIRWEEVEDTDDYRVAEIQKKVGNALVDSDRYPTIHHLDDDDEGEEKAPKAKSDADAEDEDESAGGKWGRATRAEDVDVSEEADELVEQMNDAGDGADVDTGDDADTE